jgi:formate hydrogenlyase transcriptional activator
VLFFLARFAKKFGRDVTDVAKETMDLLVGYDWPGNIRELQNVIERGVVLSTGSVLELGRDQIGPAVEPPEPSPARARPVLVVAPGVPAVAPDGASMQAVERQHMRSILDRTGGVIEGPKGAAAILKLHPNTLRNRLKKLGLR